MDSTHLKHQISNRYGVVKMLGRLGNQMFEYAFCRFLQMEYGNEARFFLSPSSHALNEFRLSSLFPLLDNTLILSQEQEGAISDDRSSQQIEYFREDHYSIVQEIPSPQKELTIYNGFWQCWQYPLRCREELLQEFSFPQENLSRKSLAMRSTINSYCSVSIHIRRTDYMDMNNYLKFGTVCDLRYYKDSIAYIRQTIDDPVFFVFSDDPHWCKENLPLEGAYFIDWNHSDNDWQDLFLMSQCRHHIIANSSFSWWGAWLSTHEDGIVVAPDIWYNTHDVGDILPPSWVRIPILPLRSTLDYTSLTLLLPNEPLIGFLNEFNGIKQQIVDKNVHSGAYFQYLYQVVKEIDTPFVGFWDPLVWTTPPQFDFLFQSIHNQCVDVAYPYTLLLQMQHYQSNARTTLMLCEKSPRILFDSIGNRSFIAKKEIVLCTLQALSSVALDEVDDTVFMFLRKTFDIQQASIITLETPAFTCSPSEVFVRKTTPANEALYVQHVCQKHISDFLTEDLINIIG